MTPVTTMGDIKARELSEQIDELILSKTRYWPDDWKSKLYSRLNPVGRRVAFTTGAEAMRLKLLAEIEEDELDSLGWIEQLIHDMPLPEMKP
jgi:hypothetical protein